MTWAGVHWGYHSQRSKNYRTPRLQEKTTRSTSWSNSSEAKFAAWADVEQAAIAGCVPLRTPLGLCVFILPSIWSQSLRELLEEGDSTMNYKLARIQSFYKITFLGGVPNIIYPVIHRDMQERRVCAICWTNNCKHISRFMHDQKAL